MKDKGKVKVCFKCYKLYNKCFCAKPWKREVSLWEVNQILLTRKNEEIL